MSEDDEDSLSFGGGEASRTRTASSIVKRSQHSSTQATSQQKSSKPEDRSPLVAKAKKAANSLSSSKRPEIVSPLSALSKSQLVRKLAEVSAGAEEGPGGVLLAPGVLNLSEDAVP